MAAKSSSADPNIDVTSPYTPRRPSPIVSISLNNPIGQAFRKIKNFLTHKQTLFATTFTIKVTPIVAIVSLLGIATVFGGGITTAYTFGKTVEQKLLATSPTPTPKIVVQTPIVSVQSKTGTVKATYMLPALTPSPTVIVNNQIATDSSNPRNDISPTPTPQILLHYILVSRSGSITYLASKNVNLQNYLNLRVLLTGNFNTTTNTLEVTKSSDIEILQ